MNPEIPLAQPNIEANSVESGQPIANAEQYNSAHEVNNPFGEVAPAANNIESARQSIQATLPPVVSAPTNGDASQTAIVATDDTPLLAADEDLIEKEWVDKIKNIIALTRDDPYERNRAIMQIQAHYLKKRYNKTVGQANE